MKKKLLRGMMSTILTGAMVLSMGMSALAETEQPDPVDKVSFTKTVTADGNTYAPNTTFNFSIAPAGAVGSKIKAGIGDYVLSADSIAFAPEKGKLSEKYINAGEIKVDLKNGTEEIVFTAPGVYHYIMTEVVPADLDKYTGITYSTQFYDLYVTILNGGEDGLYCAGITTEADDGKGNIPKAGVIDFVNDYGSKFDVKITKLVTGNMADMNQAFEFKMKVRGDETGEVFRYMADGQEPGDLSGDAGAEDYISVFLKNGESVTIYGLTEEDMVDVHETDVYESEAAGYGYTVTRHDLVEADFDIIGDAAANRGIIATVNNPGAEVTIENNKNVGPSTGVALTFGPYALMVLLAGAFAAMFLRKKKGYDEF